MLIRNAVPEDARAIAAFIAMAESEMIHHFTGTTDPEAATAALMEYILSPTENRYSLANNTVAELDGRTAGSIIAFPADRQPALDTVLLASMNRRGYDLERLFFEGESGTYYLSTMGVDPAFRGKGLGTALLEGACAKGRHLGFDRASLLVSKNKDKARALYERLGFVPLADVRIADVEYCRMARDLPPA